jgi:hypothetical protein
MEFASRIPQAPQPCYWRLAEKNEETEDGPTGLVLTPHREGGKFRGELRGKFGGDLTPPARRETEVREYLREQCFEMGDVHGLEEVGVCREV